MFNVRPEDLWPWIRFKPPSNDPPGFRMAADGSIRGADDAGPEFRGDNSSANTAPSPDIGFGEYPFGLIAPYTPATDPIPSFDGQSLLPHATAPLFPQTTEPQQLWPSLQGYGSDPGTRPETPVPGFHVKPPADNAPGFRVVPNSSARDASPDTSKITSFGYAPQADAATPVGVGSSRPNGLIEDDVYPASYGAYNLTSPAALPRDPVQEALDQIKRIYAGVGRSSADRFELQGAISDPIMRMPGSAFSDASPAIGEAFDPQYIVPANNRFPAPPSSGKGQSGPAGSKQTPSGTSGPQQPTPKSPSGTQLQPDTSEHAAAVNAVIQQRATAYNTHREHLQQLDPDNPLLKLEPVSGETPDQAIVDRYGTEVRRIVREKVDQTVGDLSAQSTYEQRSIVRTTRGDVDLRAEFERLKAAGKRVDGGRGQYGRDDELYELPGGVRVGFRMANDTRTGTQRSIPTLEIIVPGRKPIRFHYNNER